MGTGVGACGPLLCTLPTVQCLPWVVVKPNTPNFGHKCILHIIVWNLHQWTHFTQNWLHWGGTGQIILSGVFITGYTILHGGSLDLSSSSVAILFVQCLNGVSVTPSVASALCRQSTVGYSDPRCTIHCPLPPADTH